jgi:hypothetical protein
VRRTCYDLCFNAKSARAPESIIDFVSRHGEDIAVVAELYLKLPDEVSVFGVFLAFIVRQRLHVADNAIKGGEKYQGARRVMQIMQHSVMMPEQKAAEIVKGYGGRRHDGSQDKRHVSLKELHHHAHLIYMPSDSIRIGEELRQGRLPAAP